MFNWYLESVIGIAYTTITSKPEEVLGKFNGLLQNQLFILFNEFEMVGRTKYDKTQRGDLKTLITDKRQNIQKKGKEVTKEQIFCNAAALTNKKNPIILEPDDRHVAIFEVAGTYSRIVDPETGKSKLAPGSKQYFKELAAALTPLAARHFLAWLLMQADEAKEVYLADMPQTAIRVDIINNSRSEEDKFLADYDWRCNTWDDEADPFKGYRVDIIHDDYVEAVGNSAKNKQTFGAYLKKQSEQPHPIINRKLCGGYPIYSPVNMEKFRALRESADE